MIVGVFGPQGSGKSFICVLFSRLLIRTYPELSLYTNMNVTGQNINVISDLNQLPYDRSPKILIVDEAMFSIDSRQSSSHVNVLWTRALAYFRKVNVCAAFFATHRPSMLEVRIREQMSYSIMCRKNPTHFDYLMIDMTAQTSKPFQVPKHDYVFEFANYDTYDFPYPIDVLGLADDERFRVRNVKDDLRKKLKEKEKEKAGAVAT
jgi:hypothetical protein